VYGVLKSLASLAADLDPDELIICWDGGSNKRKAIFPDYKANRNKDPEFIEDLIRQLAILKRFFDTLPVIQCYENGVEADDVIAVLTVFLKLEEVGIVTSDSDLFQLCVPKNHYIIDPKSHAKVKLEMQPEQFLAYRLLVGNKDNVPGVHMVGDKTARKLLDRFKTLDRILQHSKKQGGLGSVSHKDVVSVITRNTSLWDLKKPHITEEEKRDLLNQYKFGRLKTVLDKQALHDRCVEFGLSSLIRKFSGFCGSFRTLCRGTGVHKKVAKNSMVKKDKKGSWTKRLRVVVTAGDEGERNKKRGCCRTQKRTERTSNSVKRIYASRIRKVEANGVTAASRSRHSKTVVRTDKPRATKGTVGRRNCRIEFADKGTATYDNVRESRTARKAHALFILSVLSAKDGWQWLKEQPTNCLKFVSKLIEAVEKEETTLISKSQLKKLESIYNEYCDEPPVWLD